jgi:hypothetical protein
VPLREFLEGFTVGMAMLGVMLVLTAIADKLSHTPLGSFHFLPL